MASINRVKALSKLVIMQKKPLCPCYEHGLPYQKSVREVSTEPYESTPLENIRNFSIIAHVDHGKSTLADRLLEITGAIIHSQENKQVLDRLPVEKERGITVKAVAASLNYSYNDTRYLLNLIDTPGHVDFSNEVSRSLAACQGVILLVDANEGIQAQTVANFYLAFTMELEIIPVLNKIDLKFANPEKVETQLKNVFDIEPSSVLRVSAKTGLGVEEMLKQIVQRIPPPNGVRQSPLRALLIDSWFKQFLGTVLFVCVIDGEVRIGDEICSHKTGNTYTVKSVEKLTPEEVSVDRLQAGEVGAISCNMKNTAEACVGDTIYHKDTSIEALPSFRAPKACVFAGVYPLDQGQHLALRSAIEKLCLNDPAVSFKTDNSPAFGFGWQLGFLGLLHLDVFRQRLEQEYDADIILTAPSITYKFKIKGSKNIKIYGKDMIEVSDASKCPDPVMIEESWEPFVLVTIIAPVKYLSEIIAECMDRRGIQQNSLAIDSDRVMMKFKMPLAEIIVDFHDKLKSMSSGYASFDYEGGDYELTNLVKLNILINGKIVEELSMIVHATKAEVYGRQMVLKLKDTIPRQQILVAIQAAINSKIIARENIKPYRKDVTWKIHGGGDPTRKQKRLKEQAEGKKKMRAIGNVLIHKDTFIDVLKRQ